MGLVKAGQRMGLERYVGIGKRCWRDFFCTVSKNKTESGDVNCIASLNIEAQKTCFVASKPCGEAQRPAMNRSRTFLSWEACALIINWQIQRIGAIVPSTKAHRHSEYKIEFMLQLKTRRNFPRKDGSWRKATASTF